MNENERRQLDMFGTTSESALRAFDGRIGPDPIIYIMSVLSDAQYMIEQGQHESARQHINVAKLLLSERISPAYR